MVEKLIDKTCGFLISYKQKKFFERLVFILAISTFIIHSIIIALINFKILPIEFYSRSSTMPDPLSTIYLPFSIILLYEVYLLVYYLPHSIKTYLGKQYEIITLILIRKIFSELSLLSANSGEFSFESIQKLLLTFGGLIILCLFIFLFYRLAKKSKIRTVENDHNYHRFVLIKKVLTSLLMILFIVLFLLSFREIGKFENPKLEDMVTIIKTMSNTFFNDFFIALILIEVLFLLFTFSLTDNFSKVIRNSGFIISTILLKLSFRANDKVEIITMIIAVAFGVAMLAISNLYEKKLEC